MAQTCNNCGDKTPINVPYVVHESAMARAERQSKRLVTVIILLIVLLVGSTVGWLIYNSQFEVVETWEQEVLQDANNGENTFIGGDLIGKTDN